MKDQSTYGLALRVPQAVDADGDHDDSKKGEVEKAAPKPLSATIGQNISTAA